MATLLLLVLACTDPKPARGAQESPDGGPGDEGGEDSGQDSGGAPNWEEPDLVPVAEWTEEDLPRRGEVKGTQPGIAIGDLDGDGWLDALLAYAGGSLGLRNDGAGNLLVDESIDADGEPLPPGESIALADLDADGDLDGVLGRWFGEPDLLLYNDGHGRFTSFSLGGTEGATFTTSVGDLDGDSDLDLYFAAGAQVRDFEEISSGAEQGDPNLLYLQEGGVFVVAEERMPAESTLGITFQGQLFDAEGDGDIDIYVANDAGPFITGNHLLLNDGRASFTEAADCGCDLVTFAMGAAVGDADQDGLPDLYVTDVGGPKLLRNLGGASFADATLAMGASIPPEPESLISWAAAFVDLDQDMDQDLLVTFGQSGDDKVATMGMGWEDGEEQPDQVLLSDGAGQYSRGAFPSFQEPGRSRSAAVGDLDRDGRPDVLIAGKHFLSHWRGTGGAPAGITLQLRAAGQNLQGIGARVEVSAGGRTETSWLLPSTTGGSSALELYLGLGGAPEAELLRITWPNGEVVELEGVGPGLLIVEQ